MATTTVKSPNPAFSGVKAGVVFNKGVAKLTDDDGAALAYFRRQGYTVGSGSVEAREDLPHDANAVAEQTFAGTEEENRGRHDVAVPPPSAGVEEWRVFARGYNLHRSPTDALDLKKASKQDIIDRATALGLID